MEHGSGALEQFRKMGPIDFEGFFDPLEAEAW